MTARVTDALLELVVCPACRGDLTPDPGGLRCTRCAAKYPSNAGVPALMPRPAGPVSLAGRVHHALLGHPRLYDFHQAHGGGRTIAAHVRAQLAEFRCGTMLDIGAGTGMVADVVASGVQYIWVDNDVSKLHGFLSKRHGGLAVLADAEQLPLRDRAVEWSVMVEVSHHLPDAAFHACVAEAARVTRDTFLFVDALRGDRLRSKALWQLDLGRHPRTENEILGVLANWFELTTVQHFRINHDHVLCLCVPRRVTT